MHSLSCIPAVCLQAIARADAGKLKIGDAVVGVSHVEEEQGSRDTVLPWEWGAEVGGSAYSGAGAPPPRRHRPGPGACAANMALPVRV